MTESDRAVQEDTSKQSQNDLLTNEPEDYRSTLGCATRAQNERDKSACENILDPDKSNSFTIENDQEQKKDWTVAINLAANIPGQPELGAAAKAQKLKEMASATEGKSITIIAQDVVPNPNYKEGSENPGETNQYNLERFEIQNGEVKQLPTKASESYEKDVQDLLETAGEESPSEKLALILQSHGKGNQGMRGDQSDTTLDELTNAISDGLKNTGHDKLDVLDFDACTMAEAGVLDKTKDIANNVVASAELEAASSGAQVDGQDLPNALKALAQNTSMDGKEFGDTIVSESTSPGQDGSVSISTLANFDQSKEQQFHDALNNFGEQLQESISDPNNARVIDNIIDNTPRYAALADDSETKGAEDRDLKSFATQVQDAIKSGQLTDPDNQLAQAAQNVLDAQKEITQSYYGEPGTDYEHLGGLSVFLPGQEYRDDQTVAQKISPINSIGRETEPMRGPSGDDPRSSSPEFRKYLEADLDHEMDDLKKHVPEADQPRLEGLQNSVDRLKQAKTPEEFQSALQAVNDEAKRLQESELNQEVAKSYEEPAEENKKKVFSQDYDENETGWNGFIASLDQLQKAS